MYSVFSSSNVGMIFPFLLRRNDGPNGVLKDGVNSTPDDVHFCIVSRQRKPLWRCFMTCYGKIDPLIVACREVIRRAECVLVNRVGRIVEDKKFRPVTVERDRHRTRD